MLSLIYTFIKIAAAAIAVGVAWWLLGGWFVLSCAAIAAAFTLHPGLRRWQARYQRRITPPA